MYDTCVLDSAAYQSLKEAISGHITPPTNSLKRRRNPEEKDKNPNADCDINNNNKLSISDIVIADK